MVVALFAAAAAMAETDGENLLIETIDDAIGGDGRGDMAKPTALTKAIFVSIGLVCGNVEDVTNGTITDPLILGMFVLTMDPNGGNPIGTVPDIATTGFNN